MKDYGAEFRQKFIADSRLAEKLREFKRRMHAENKALLGEEVQAEREGWLVFHQHKIGEPRK